MTRGLRVTGASGQKQIDETSISYLEHSRGSASLSPPMASADGFGWRALISLPDPSALVAVRIRGAETGGGGYTQYGFSYVTGSQFRAVCLFSSAGSFSGESPFIEYIIYTKATIGSGSFGLRIRDTTGKILYSSAGDRKICNYVGGASWLNQAGTVDLSSLSSNVNDYFLVSTMPPYFIERQTVIVPGFPSVTRYVASYTTIDRQSGLQKKSTESVVLDNGVYAVSPINYLFPSGSWSFVNYSAGAGTINLIRVTG
jgi:hypothetical protein